MKAGGVFLHASLLYVAKLAKGNVELGLEIGNPAELNLGVGFERFDSLPQLGEAICEAVLTCWPRRPWLALLALRSRLTSWASWGCRCGWSARACLHHAVVKLVHENRYG